MQDSDVLSLHGTLQEATACTRPEKTAKYLKETSDSYDVVMTSNFLFTY